MVVGEVLIPVLKRMTGCGRGKSGFTFISGNKTDLNFKLVTWPTYHGKRVLR